MSTETNSQPATAPAQGQEALPIREEFFEKKDLTSEDVRRLRKTIYQSIRTRRTFEEQVRTLDENDRASLFKKGIALWMLGRWSEAAEKLKPSATHPVGGIFYVESLLALERTNEAIKVLEGMKGGPEVDMGLLAAHVDVKNFEEAEKAFKKLAKEHESTAAYQVQKGLLHDAYGERAEAKAAYTKALELDPRHSMALFRLAYDESIYGDVEEAIDLYERCIEIEPAYEEAMLNLGTLYEDTEHWEFALRCYDAILDENPAHDRARMFKKDAIASMTMYFDEDLARRADKHNQALQVPITDFELSVRSRNCLQKMNIRTLGDLVQKTEQELLSYKNFGETSLLEIKNLLGKRGLRLGMGRGGSGAAAPGKPPIPDDVLRRLVAEIDLSIRCRNCLATLGVETISDLVERSEEELMAVRNFGQTSLNEIKAKLGEMGLSLRE